MNRRIRNALLAVVAAGAATCSHAALVNLLSNGSFETGDFTGWTQFGNTGFNGVACSTGFGYASDCAGFFGPIGSTGGISQTLTGLEVGGTYIVSFALAAIGDVPSSFTVGFGGSTLLNFTNPGVNNPNGSYELFALNVVATAATQTVSFTFRDDPGFMLMDAVSVTVPEPTTAALVGLALAGLALSRRKLTA